MSLRSVFLTTFLILFGIPILLQSEGPQFFGVASFYAEHFAGQQTASGGIYDPGSMTAAHRTLPLLTFVRVTNLKNLRSVVVKITDRGPYIKNRVIDLSSKAAEKLGMKKSGIAPVQVEVLD
jgi:rare lipoprotein A